MVSMPFTAVQELLERELKGHAERLFTWIDPSPFMVDDETQTHRGHFHNGQEVAITVADPRASHDLITAGRNADHLRSQHLASQVVHVPIVYWQFTTPTVLVREHQEGMPLDAAILKDHGHDVRAAARALFLLFAEAFVGEGWHYQHAPGRLLTVTPDVRLFVHACDRTVQIPHAVRAAIAHLMDSYVRGDSSVFLRSLSALAGSSDVESLHTTESAVAAWLHDHPGLSFGHALSAIVDVSPFASQHLHQIRDILVNLEQDIVTLYPTFDFTSAYEALTRHALARPMSLQHLPRYQYAPVS